MLKKLRLHNFKTFLNAEIEFQERHLLIGRNNSGKTNLCSALRFLKGAAIAELEKVSSSIPGGVWEITNWALDSKLIELSCECDLTFEEEELQFTYTLSLEVSSEPPSGKVELRVRNEKLEAKGARFGNAALIESDGHQAHLLHEKRYMKSEDGCRVDTLAPRDSTMLSKLYELDTNRRAIAFRRYLAGWSDFALSPLAMRMLWRESPSDSVGLSSYGNTLPQALFHLKNLNEASYRRVIDFVRENAEPELDAIHHIPAPDQPPVPIVALKSRLRTSWNGLSDGTLRLLALALIVESAANLGDQPTFAIIEEPENGIYPGMLRKVFELFEERAPNAQFLFTSHSPYFINLFDGKRESVTLLRRNKERTEIIPAPPEDQNPDREMLAEQYSMELFD